MASFPSPDLRDLDVDAAARELRRVGSEAGEAIADSAAGFAKAATYTAVGLGLLAYQRLQVKRRDLEREMRRSS